MSTLACFHAAAVLPHADAWVRDGVVVVDRGRVLEVLSAAEARACHAGAAWHELGDVVLTAGLVNAHAHLELGALHGRCPAGAGMLPWIGGVLRERASLVAGDFARGVAEGARRLLATGTTTVGDIDSSGASAAELGASGLRGRVYREVLDARDAGRLADARARLELRVAAGPRGRVLPGVSPHGPHTVSAELLAAAVARARAEGSALSVHLAESDEEVRWLQDGGGPFAAVLGASPRRGGVDLLADAGALAPGTSLVHANALADAELAAVVAAGAVLVHCPGTHRFFARAGAPLTRWVRAGAVCALGTDSLASNEDLDLRRELALAARAHPELEPATLWRMATEGGAAALDLAGEVGRLAPGAWADLVAFDAPTSDRAAALDALVRERPTVRAVLIGGAPVPAA